jgi:hypothetical protein
MVNRGQIGAIRILAVIAFLFGAIVFLSPIIILQQMSETPNVQSGQTVEYNSHGHHVFMTVTQAQLVNTLPIAGWPIFMSGFLFTYFADRREG